MTADFIQRFNISVFTNPLLLIITGCFIATTVANFVGMDAGSDFVRGLPVREIALMTGGLSMLYGAVDLLTVIYRQILGYLINRQNCR
ncbi:hypothetical protein [Thalassotalea sp. PS06]|uniref:hypothetical protein n=1 Tax=Thalassotalea sp. PS06 TaxID=2594005 RepID=UPI0011628B21|nr:hypothetical protein [Thalassotalea sp. PS06]QDP00892.1 hypothetical protein FNC98_05730 [Thalassotalea sp. PS06]